MNQPGIVKIFFMDLGDCIVSMSQETVGRFRMVAEGISRCRLRLLSLIEVLKDTMGIGDCSPYYLAKFGGYPVAVARLHLVCLGQDKN